MTKQSMTTSYNEYGASISIHDVDPIELQEKSNECTIEQRKDGERYYTGKLHIGDIDIVLFSTPL